MILAGPILIIAVLEFSRWALDSLAPTLRGRLVMDGAVLAGAIFFSVIAAVVMGDLMTRLERRNRELQALRAASLDITADLTLDSVLQKIVDRSRELLSSRYGALAVYSAEGSLQTFVTSGVDDLTRGQIGEPPKGLGLLRIPLEEGHSLRLADLATHGRSAGFPTNHPPMRSLLAVPVNCHQECRGNLYLSEKEDGSPFSEEDETILTRFAAQAAIAVDNAYLHAQVASLAVVNERLHLAREMHDGQAQVLAYVNTKAQVIDQLLAAGKIEAARQHLKQIASASREVYADVREGILGLRTAVDNDHDLALVLREYAERWQDQCGIPVEVEIEGDARYEFEVELQMVRVLQEALANVRKHSQAKKAWLRASIQRHRFVAEVEDDGVGFETAPTQDASPNGALPRFGLDTMRERCADVGASLEIFSKPGDGTRIRLAFPAIKPRPQVKDSESKTP